MKTHVGRIKTAVLMAIAVILLVESAEIRAAETLATVVLKDGREKKGRIESETETTIFLEIEPGEVLPIAKTGIQEVIRSGAGAGEVAKPGGGKAAAGKVEADPEFPQPLFEQGPAGGSNTEAQRIYEDLKDLGHPLRNRREAALERALDLGFRAVPIMLAVFHPKQQANPDLQIGVLRALAQLGPLDNQAAKTLGWIAMKTRDREVHREACRTIRLLKEDRALGYILGFSTSTDKGTQIKAATALREINDDRAFAALAGSIPAPKINAAPNDNATFREIPNMPVGGGLRGPLFLPESEVQGTAENTMSAQAETLAMIAGKELGGLQAVWVNWLNEKIGTWTQEEREENYKQRSLMGRMGTPQAQGGK